MKKKLIEVGRGNAKVRINVNERVKNGTTYHSFIVNEYQHDERTRKRRRIQHSFSSEADARSKATEVAEALAAGKTDVLRWEEDYRAEIRMALEAVKETGMTILPACQLFRQAVGIVGSADDLLAAVQYWKTHRPNKPLTPVPVKDAVDDYLRRRKDRLSFKRHSTESCYLTGLKCEFGDTLLHELEPSEVQDFMDGKPWNAKTRNDFLTSLSGFFKDAQLRHNVPENCNPAKRVPRRKEVRGPVHVFRPFECRQILSRLSLRDPELVPFVAIWCFAGIRKDEIARMTWQQVNRGLTTGHIEMEASITKTQEARTVPVTDNLRAWLTLFRKDSGAVVPTRWMRPTKKRPNTLDEMTRHITRKTGIVWKFNAPRHSFGTYYFKACKDPGEVVRAMGTSLEKFQEHYWCKANTVTEAEAAEWFKILPEGHEKIVPMEAASAAG